MVPIFVCPNVFILVVTLILAGFVRVVFTRVCETIDSRKRQQKYAEYCRNRAEFYRLERLKIINSFWRKYRSGTYPVDVLLHRLKEGLCFNSGGSTEWQEEFAQVVDELNRESADEQQRFYQEDQTVSPYTDGINLDAYYRIFGLTPETLTAENLKKAYRSLCLRYHPDRNKQPDAAVKFDKVQRVYETLQRELAHKNA